MAHTPYKDLLSQDILSAHISGLAHSIIKIEKVLNMKTKKESFSLSPVNDQDDFSYHYRIYEGTNRNWLDGYIVKRDGKEVSSDEYEAQGEFGVVVFHENQTPNSNISVEATYIIPQSTKIDTISKDSEDNKKAISTLSGRVGENEKSIKELKENSSSDGNSSSSGGGIDIPLKIPGSVHTNIRPGKSTADLTEVSSVLMAGGKIDSMPIIIEKRTKISRLQMDGSSNTVASKAIMGIYGDIDTSPGDLLGETAVFDVGSGRMFKNLKEPVILEPGVYWVTRWSEEGIRLEGFNKNDNINILVSPTSSSHMDGNGTIIGVRSKVMKGLTSLPNPHPSVGSNATDSKYLARDSYGPVYALK